MSSMFRGTKFNQDLTAWGETGNSRQTQTLDDIECWGHASSFDQALGWCVEDVDADNAFEGTECEATFCGFAQCSAREEDATFCKLDDEYSCSGTAQNQGVKQGNVMNIDTRRRRFRRDHAGTRMAH